jgi:hypothetical protein
LEDRPKYIVAILHKVKACPACCCVPRRQSTTRQFPENREISRKSSRPDHFDASGLFHCIDFRGNPRLGHDCRLATGHGICLSNSQYIWRNTFSNCVWLVR